jgi:hypothetical protein
MQLFFLDGVRYLKSSSCLDNLLWIYEMKNGYIYSANVDVYYPDIKFVYDTQKRLLTKCQQPLFKNSSNNLLRDLSDDAIFQAEDYRVPRCLS